MAYIQTVHPWRARSELRQVYRAIRRDMVGRLPVPLSSAVWNTMRVFSLRPALLRAFERCFLLSMWGGHRPRDPSRVARTPCGAANPEGQGGPAGGRSTPTR
jgi:hypothetical protein